MNGPPLPAPAAPDPSAIVRLSTAYWESQTLLTANRLRLFDFLADGARSADEVAAGLPPRPAQHGLVSSRLRRAGLPH